jgi:hypothetical protein
MDLIPSLAFTALMELNPTYCDMSVEDVEARALTNDLTTAMRDALDKNHPDLWQFAQSWIVERTAAKG